MQNKPRKIRAVLRRILPWMLLLIVVSFVVAAVHSFFDFSIWFLSEDMSSVVIGTSIFLSAYNTSVWRRRIKNREQEQNQADTNAESTAKKIPTPLTTIGMFVFFAIFTFVLMVALSALWDLISLSR